MSRESDREYALDAWRSRLTRLLDEAVQDHGVDAVRSALRDHLARLAPADPERLVLERPVLGLDASPAGWVGVLLQPGRPATVHAGARVSAIVEQVREAGDLAVVGIDIPIGLPDHSGRAADALARRALPGKASSVFPTATRAAYLAPDYEEARARNVAATGGTSLSRQAWGLRAKLLEVDAWVRSRPTVTVIEVHPELSFARIACAPVLASKKTADGIAARREALDSVGLVAPPWYPGQGFGEDDLLDACAVAWTAARRARGAAESLPAEPEVFGDGIAAAIWV